MGELPVDKQQQQQQQGSAEELFPLRVLKCAAEKRAELSASFSPGAL